MKNRRMAGLGAAVIILVGALLVFTTSGEDSTSDSTPDSVTAKVATSKDGRIMAIAHPDEVDDEFAVTVVAAADHPPEVTEIGIQGEVYDLQPAGATFEQPVTVLKRIDLEAIDVDVSKGRPVALILSRNSDSGAWEYMDNQRTFVDGNTMVVGGTTQHFSEVVTVISPVRFADDFTTSWEGKDGAAFTAAELIDPADPPSGMDDLFTGERISLDDDGNVISIQGPGHEAVLSTGPWPNSPELDTKPTDDPLPLISPDDAAVGAFGIVDKPMTVADVRDELPQVVPRLSSPYEVTGKDAMLGGSSLPTNDAFGGSSPTAYRLVQTDGPLVGDINVDGVVDSLDYAELLDATAKTRQSNSLGPAFLDNNHAFANFQLQSAEEEAFFEAMVQSAFPPARIVCEQPGTQHVYNRFTVHGGWNNLIPSEEAGDNKLLQLLSGPSPDVTLISGLQLDCAPIFSDTAAPPGDPVLAGIIGCGSFTSRNGSFETFTARMSFAEPFGPNQQVDLLVEIDGLSDIETTINPDGTAEIIAANNVQGTKQFTKMLLEVTDGDAQEQVDLLEQLEAGPGLQFTQASEGELFKDGFESGDVPAWSTTCP